MFLGKIDPQDSYLLYNGTHLVLARSVRRINTCWKGHLAFYLSFNCASYEYRSSFGGRVVPTKSSRAPIAPSTLQLEMWNPPNSLMRTLRQSGRKLLKSNVKTMKQPTWPSTTNRTLCRRWINSLRFDWKMQV